MATVVRAYAATEAKGKLAPFEYELGALGGDEVEIAIEHCGICHSDLSMLNDDWGMSQYPFVPGHEAIGTIEKIGDRVTSLKVGDRVGLGWHAGYCMTCQQCLTGDHNMCASAEGTIVGRHGAFGDRVRAQAASTIRLPDGLDPRTAGPLLCGGITVFNPLVQYDISPTANVAVIGIGGLGHLAIQFARAWGCRVTAFTSSPSKQDEAIALGAHDTLNSRDPDAIAAAAGRFDLILSTVNVSLDWDGYLGTLKPRGRLHLLGVVTEPLSLNIVPMIFSQLDLSASPVGSPATIAQMLEFAAQHGIAPKTEHFPMSRVNEALEHLHAGKARYRIVLDRD